jgi:hypothetical protein
MSNSVLPIATGIVAAISKKGKNDKSKKKGKIEKALATGIAAAIISKKGKIDKPKKKGEIETTLATGIAIAAKSLASNPDKSPPILSFKPTGDKAKKDILVSKIPTGLASKPTTILSAIAIALVSSISKHNQDIETFDKNLGYIFTPDKSTYDSTITSDLISKILIELSTNKIHYLKAFVFFIIFIFGCISLYSSKLEITGFAIFGIIYLIFGIYLVKIQSQIFQNYYVINNPDSEDKKYMFFTKEIFKSSGYIYDILEYIPSLYYFFTLPFMITIVILMTLISLIFIITAYANINSVYAPLNVPTTLDLYLYTENDWLYKNKTLPYLIKRQPINHPPNNENGVKIKEDGSFEYVLKKDQYKILLILVTCFMILCIFKLDFFDIIYLLTKFIVNIKEYEFIPAIYSTYLSKISEFIIVCFIILYGICYNALMVLSGLSVKSKVVFSTEIIYQTVVFIFCVILMGLYGLEYNDFMNLSKIVVITMIYIILCVNVWLTFIIYDGNLPSKITTPNTSIKIDNNVTSLPGSNSYGSIDPDTGFNTTNINGDNTYNPGSVIYPKAYPLPNNAAINPYRWFDIRYYL